MAKKKYLKTEADLKKEAEKKQIRDKKFEKKEAKNDKHNKKIQDRYKKEYEKQQKLKDKLNKEGKLKHRDVGYHTEAELLKSKQLEAELRNSTYDFIEFSEYGQKWLEATGHREIGEVLNKQNDAYIQRMTMMCAIPLMRGFNLNSLVQTAGTFLGMSMFNKDLANNIKNNIGMNFQNSNNPLLQKVGSKFISSNVKRAAYTPETAAMAKLSLDRTLYNSLRVTKQLR